MKRCCRVHDRFGARGGAVVLFALFLLAGRPPFPSAAEAFQPNVLILNSYHPGETWSDNELAGIVPTLQRVYPFLVPAVEHLDAKRFPSDEHRIFTQEYLRRKYSGRRFDLVMTVDNCAFDVAMACRQDLFRGVPVVFAGINGFQPQQIARKGPVTGVAEIEDMAGTLELAMSMHPAARRVFAVHDNTSSGLAVRREMETVARAYAGKIDIGYPSGGSLEALQRQLAALPSDSIVLILTYVTDDAGRTLTREESTRLICAAAKVPVYAMHETRLGFGIVGGMLLEGRSHGAQAAEMALKILGGADASTLPVESSRSHAVFDYRQMERFGISPGKLPTGSTVINRPPSFFEQHRSMILPAGAIAAVLFGVIALLSMMLFQIRKTRDQLEASEERYRRIVETANEGIWAMDGDFRTTYVNQIMAAMLGYKAGEMIGIPVTAFMLPDELADHSAKMSKRRAGRPDTYIRQFRKKDGSAIWANVSATPLVDAHGNFAGSFAMFTDITQRILAQRALQASEQRLRVLFDQAVDGIGVVEAESGIIVDCNDTLAKMVGRSKSELIGQPQRIFHPPQDTLNGVTPTFAAHRGSRSGEILNERIVTASGQVREVEIKADFIEIEGRRHLMSLFRDVTDTIRLRAQLQQSQKMESIGTLAGGIAHDFNNILASIIGFTELALDDGAHDGALREHLQEVYAAANRAKELVKQILTFARRSDEERKPIQAARIAEESICLIRSTVPTTIDIRQRIENGSLVMANAGQLHQVFMNLLTNAAQAMEENGGVLEFELGDVELDGVYGAGVPGLPAGRYLKIRVSDTGEGIAPQDMASIFEPYFTTKRPGEGTGMGLALVHGIVESYGGKIVVESKPGRGSTFCVYLPVTGSREGESADISETLPTGNERILLVDDEPPIARMAGQTLERLGYRVTTRTSAVETLELFRASPAAFDLVITDFTMPTLTGDHLAAQLLSIRPDIPIVICTGFSRRISEDTAATLGAQAFLYKPMSRARLAETVRKVLDRAKKSP